MLIAALLLPLPTMARTLEVGPDRDLKAPSAAARVAQDGDVIRIDPGEYFDCASWRANHLTIEAAGPGVVLTDTACAGKANFVLSGHDTTINGLMFTRIRVPDGNGAGIRAEGGSLTVLNSRFTNNQAAILAADSPDSVITIRDSQFIDNGACTAHGCVGTILVGAVARLDITGSTIQDTRGGQPVASAADALVLTGNRIEDGPEGSSSTLVQQSGPGSLLMQGNTLEKGPHTTNPHTAVLLVADAGPQGSQLVRDNRFTNDTGGTTAFVTDWTSGSPQMQGNIFAGPVTELTSSGRLRHRLITLAYDTKAALHNAAAAFYHSGLQIVRELR